MDVLKLSVKIPDIKGVVRAIGQLPAVDRKILWCEVQAMVADDALIVRDEEFDGPELLALRFSDAAKTVLLEHGIEA